MLLILCKIWGGRLNSLSDGMDNFLLCNLNRASVSVSHRLVNITVAQLFEVVHDSRHLGVHIRVTLLTCAELCSRLQLCSTARSLHSDPSLAGSLASSSRSTPTVPRQSSAPAGWSSPLRYHVCRKTCLLSCLSDASWRVTSPIGALIGPPTAFPRTGPSVPWVSLPGPTGVITHQR